MPYEVSWDHNDTTLLWLRFYQSLTWEEYAQAFEAVVKEVKKVPYRVNVILNAEIPVPPGNPLDHFRRALKRLAELDNLDLLISVNPGTGLFVLVMIEMLTRVYVPRMAGRLPFVESVDEAYRLVAARRAKTVKDV